MAKQVQKIASAPVTSIASGVVATPPVATPAPAVAPTKEDKEAARIAAITPTVAGVGTSGRAVKTLDVSKMSRGIVYEINPTDIGIEPGYNVRTLQPDTDAVDGAFVRNIRALGVQTALGVRIEGTRLIVVQGHRRLEAARLAKLATVPVLILAESDKRSRVYDLHRSNNGKPLDMLGLALVAVQAAALGDDAATISRELGGYTPRYVTNLLTLGNAPESILASVRKGYLAGTEVYNTVQTFTTPLGNNPSPESKAKATDAAYDAIEACLSKHPDSKVSASTLKAFVNELMGVPVPAADALYTAKERTIYDPAGMSIATLQPKVSPDSILKLLNQALVANRKAAEPATVAPAEAFVTKFDAPSQDTAPVKAKRGRKAA